jgi:hypothetical protein
MGDSANDRLTSLRNGLLRLHKCLLDSERSIYERDVARITSAGQFLSLVLDDPHFAWLRELSQFIVLVDETLDSEEPTAAADAERLVTGARDMLLPSENGSTFARSYWEAMQRDPSVVLAHRDMMQVFAGLA